jgi:hypothetical protein
VAGSPGTSSISSVTSDTTVHTTSSKIANRRSPPRILYLKVERNPGVSQLKMGIRMLADNSSKKGTAVTVP